MRGCCEGEMILVVPPQRMWPNEYCPPIRPFPVAPIITRGGKKAVKSDKKAKEEENLVGKELRLSPLSRHQVRENLQTWRKV